MRSPEIQRGVQNPVYAFREIPARSRIENASFLLHMNRSEINYHGDEPRWSILPFPGLDLGIRALLSVCIGASVGLGLGAPTVVGFLNSVYKT